MSLCKRPRDDVGCGEQIKAVRIDTVAVQHATLKRIMAAGQEKPRARQLDVDVGRILILCEGCHKQAAPAESSDSYALVGECRFCSRRNLCIDCWTRCASCGMETCPLCSVKDYSGRDTVAVCLDCKRHHSRKPLIRR
jgi:hypothetical protein